jgi:D-3-phosphoglycerate dehydrogenase
VHVAILDDYQECVRGLACFSKLAGHRVTVLTERAPSLDALAERLADVDALVLIRERTKVNAALLARLPKLKLIAQTGRPGPHLDLAACEARGITVTSGTGSPHAPAELTWALVLAASRAVVTESAALARGTWQTTLGRTVRGKTLGILGYGRIGALVAGFGKAFGMTVQAWGRDGSRERASADGVAFAASRAAFFATSDVLSVHLKLAPETRASITRDELASMPESSLFVNTSRAELVAPGALLAALDAGRPAMAALDVFEHEPRTDEPLMRHPRVLATPHLGYVERESYELYFGQAFEQVNAFAGVRR